jgi:hypothetical protein
MKKYIGIMANTFLDLNNVRITDKLIRDIVTKQPQVPVTINFGGVSVGHTTSLFLMGDSTLACEFEIDPGLDVALIDRMYIVPGLEEVEYHMEGATRVIDSGVLNEASITVFSANTHIRPVRLKGEKSE